jgi:GNAT superfamily N-acetyltransferase
VRDEALHARPSATLANENATTSDRGAPAPNGTFSSNFRTLELGGRTISLHYTTPAAPTKTRANEAARRPSALFVRLARVSTNDDPPFGRDTPEWRVARRLSDGTAVTLRPLRAEDKPAFLEAFSRLSVETRYLRFFSVVTEPSEAILRYLTEVDQEDHVAIAALVETLDLKAERGVGLARFVRVAGEPHAAEAAVTVIDEFQKRGLGTVLLIELTRAAIARDVRVFRGEVLATNDRMLQILHAVGARLEPVGPEVAEISPGDFGLGRKPPTVDAFRFEVPLTLEDPHHENAIVHAFRAAARSMATQLRQVLAQATGEAEPRDTSE